MPVKKRRAGRKPATPDSPSEAAQSSAPALASNAMPPFTIAHPKAYPKSKKRKRTDPEVLHESSDFDESLAVDYLIRPYDMWQSLKQFRKFSIGNQTMGVGDVIYVRNDEGEASQDEAIDIQNQWFGKVLEIRAHNEQTVYVRLYWIYRPEDLPGGRRPYHGKNELVPSNHMDIVDAQTVNGKIDLRHWTETDDEADLDADSVYWRQYFDYRTSTLSAVRRHCIDEAPYNPDTLLINCSNSKCKAWLHAECIEKAAAGKVYREHIQSDHPLNVPIPEGILSAEIILQPTKADGSRVVVTDQRKGKDEKKWEEDLTCLVCHKKID